MTLGNADLAYGGEVGLGHTFVQPDHQAQHLPGEKHSVSVCREPRTQCRRSGPHEVVEADGF